MSSRIAVAPDVSTAEELNFLSPSSCEIEARLVNDISALWQFKDPELQISYEDFNVKNQTLSSLLALNVFISLLSVPLLSLYFMELGALHDAFDVLNWMIVVVVAIALNALGWGVYFQQKQAMRENEGCLPLRSKRFLQGFQKYVFTVMTIWIGYRHFLSTIIGPCIGNSNQLATLECNTAAEGAFIPPETTALLMLFPLLYTISVRGANFQFALTLWSVVVFTLTFSALYSRARNATVFLIYYCVQSFTIMVEARKQNYCLFFTQLKLQEILDERQRQSDAVNATELRHMIANVAHDLKTPLASFLGGIEYISHVVEDTRKKATVTRAELEECVTSLLECVTNMRNTNSFMLMTINRCIDYTKASKGVKLVPKYETVDLQEALALPLCCMNDIQQRIAIVLRPLPSGLCSHVITDKQWLQENVLCLLSNAVKYSSEGVVTVSVSRVERIPDTARTEDVEDGIAMTHSWLHRRIAAIGHHAGVAVDVIEFVRVEVEDHGIGLQADAMASLFSAFKQAQRLAGGTGLGLFSLAKRLEALEGRCGVSHRRDGAQGSLFWFEFPYREDSQAAMFGFPAASVDLASTTSKEKWEMLSRSQTSSRSPPSSTRELDTQSVGKRSRAPSIVLASAKHVLVQPLASSQNQSKSKVPIQAPASDQGALSLALAPSKPHIPLMQSPREAIPVWNILVVDDSPAILKMTSMMLKRHQHVVTTATNGAEAVKAVADRLQGGEGGFDVILMDLQMPVMDGLEATKRIRAMERDVASVQPFRHMIIGVSACSDHETTQDSIRSGANAFMAKPFLLETFYRAHKELSEEVTVHG